MKIVFPVNSDKTTICNCFGRADFFAFVDTESGEISFADNAAMRAERGAGTKAAQFVVGNAADVVITPRCGENAAKIFKAAQVKMLHSEVTSLKDNIEAFKTGGLCELADFRGRQSLPADEHSD